MHKLVIGIGNELRADDGAGALIVRRLEQEALPDVQTECIMQLTPEWLERLADASITILVDVRVPQDGDDGSVWLQSLQDIHQGSATGHALNIAELVALGERIYGKPIHVMVCSIPAFDFTIGNPLSDACAALIEPAVRKIRVVVEG